MSSKVHDEISHTPDYRAVRCSSLHYCRQVGTRMIVILPFGRVWGYIIIEGRDGTHLAGAHHLEWDFFTAVQEAERRLTLLDVLSSEFPPPAEPDPELPAINRHGAEYPRIAAVERLSENWLLTLDTGLEFLLRQSDAPVEPKVGMALTIVYGPSNSIQGLYLEGRRVFHRTDEEQRIYLGNEES